MVRGGKGSEGSLGLSLPGSMGRGALRAGGERRAGKGSCSPRVRGADWNNQGDIF